MRAVRRAFDSIMDRRLACMPASQLDAAARLAVVARHGGFSQAYSTAVQHGLHHFGDVEGYIAYGVKMGSIIALGDPVAARERWPEMIGDFVRAAGRPAFAEISLETAEILAGLGYRVARIGFDTALDLADYDFKGPKKEKARYAEHWLRRNGFTVVEEQDMPAAAEAVAALSAEWRSTRVVRKREMAFMNRPFPATPDTLMRRFLLVSPERRVVSLLYFDPIFRAGETVGYVAVFKRRHPRATANSELGLMKHAVDRFKEEGREVVMLSLAPLAEPGPSGFPESKPFRWAMARLYASRLVNDRVFNVQGHAEQRRRSYGRKVPRYFAWGRGSPFLHLVSLLRLCKAF